MGSEQGQDRRFCDRKATVPYHPYVSNANSRWGMSTGITNTLKSSLLNWGPKREGFCLFMNTKQTKNKLLFFLLFFPYMS